MRPTCFGIALPSLSRSVQFSAWVIIAAMLSPQYEKDLEANTAALNDWLFAEGVGLPVASDGYRAPAGRLAELYAALLDYPDTTVRCFAVENWAETRQAVSDQQISDEMDRCLRVPDLRSTEGSLTWRNWKAFERETDDPGLLAAAFEQMVARSEELVPLLEARLAAERADYARHGLTPLHTFAYREGITVEALVAMLREVGAACREPFEAAMASLSAAVFGRPAGPAELRALYLNRMYEPLAGLFRAEQAVPETLAAFAGIGFDLSNIPVDLEDRPRKYAGAFCFPLQIPGDVRVSVRRASAHHLVDMLYHEFGHAAHFSGIDAALPFIDRYWIHSGVHETFSTLFERLLDERRFLASQFGMDDNATRDLIEFGQCKLLLTGTWLCASALAVAEAWLEGLSWAEIEARYAAHMLAFTGVAMPPGYARLESFASSVSIYPAGYVMAAVRVSHWLGHLRGMAGAAWWQSSAAQDDIRGRIRAGGRVDFPAAWNGPAGLLTQIRLIT